MVRSLLMAAGLLMLCASVLQAQSSGDPETRRATPIDLSVIPTPDPNRKLLNDLSPPRRIDPTIKVTKVHMVCTDTMQPIGKSETLIFERLYWNYGAVTGDQLTQKRGNIFVFSWANKGPKADFTLRFEYRQRNSKSEVRSITIDQPDVKGGTRSIFAVVGNAYTRFGPVTSYRLSIIRDGAVVGEQKSFVW
ncbi:MAG: hypothetical protein ACAI35_02755 [Candidatus Methylacidiphilales bacterium]|nr:hypothetical protein [Candidatus Methylacidiphilales bacterium]